MLRLSLCVVAAATLALYTTAACSSDPDPAPAPDDDGSSGDDGTSSGKPKKDASADAAPAPESNVVKSSVQLDVDGPHTYVLALPKNLDPAKTYPLIVALHGDGENANDFIEFSKLDVVAGKDAIMAFTDQVLDLFTDYASNPDQKFVNAVIDDVMSKQKIDPAKIWGFGYSKGAYMLEELQCRKQSKFTAMVIEAGGAPEEQDANGNINCPGAKAIPMFLTQGTADQDTGVEYGANFWASVAGCGDTRQPTTPDYCGAYPNCNAKTPVVYCEIPGQPHFPLYDNAAADAWKWLNSLGQ